MRRSILRTGAAAAFLAVSAAGYSYSTFAKWPSVPVTFYVNPANADLTPAATVAALQLAMNAWSTAGSSFRYQYGGPATDTSIGFNNRNVTLFRSESAGSTIATAYTWWDSSNHLLDSDIVVWDGRFTFYAGTSGCGAISSSAYLEDIATHEFGHALGLNHSTVAAATMYPSYSYCSQSFRTLAPDDIAGVTALYPASAPANTAPAVSISSPASGATFVQGTTVAFSASASDAQDGNLTSLIQWTDNGAAIGSGGTVSRVMNVAGTHVIVARVTDSGSLTTSSQITLAITTPSTAGTLQILQKPQGSTPKHRVDLKWSGVAGTSVDVYRNGVSAYPTPNDGRHVDFPGTTFPMAVTYTYKVCVTGTTTCTNTATTVF